MNTFEQELNNTAWTEILLGKGMIAFDLLEDAAVYVLFTESESQPSVAREGNRIASWGEDWDFHASGLVVNKQYIWIKGTGEIRGVR